MSRAFALVLPLVATTAWADEPPTPPPPPTFATRIDGVAGRGMSGVASINLVAGRGNAQANLAAIAQGGFNAAHVAGAQATAVAAGDAARGAVARITDAALGGGRGVLAVNQAAGAANAQLNVLAIGGDEGGAHLIQNVDVTALAAVASGVPLEPDAVPVLPPTREARIDGSAFARPQGVLQINQTAGV
ncbi:hypothetical protein, partial [Cognatilysobacter segetis]